MAALRGVEPGAINFCSVMLEAELETVEDHYSKNALLVFVSPILLSMVERGMAVMNSGR